MPLEQLDPSTFQPVSRLRQLSPDTLEPIGDKLQKILSAPGPSTPTAKTMGEADAVQPRAILGGAVFGLGGESAGEEIAQHHEKMLSKELPDTPIGREAARLAGSAEAGALTPFPGMSTAARAGWNVAGTVGSDLMGLVTDNPLARFAAGIGIGLMAQHGLDRAYGIEPFERAQGAEPKVGMEATAAAKEVEGVPATPSEPAETAESKPAEPAPKSKLTPIKALRVGEKIITPKEGDIMHAQMWERLPPDEQEIAEPGWLYGDKFESDSRTRPMRPADVKESLDNLAWKPGEEPKISKAQGDILNAQTVNPKGEVFYLKAKDLREKPDLLKVDPETYQFKQGVNAKGVTKQLETIKRWENGAQGTSTVHHTAEGDFVAEGHHRLEAFKRLAKDDDTLRFQVLNGTNEDIPGALEYDDPITGEKKNTGVSAVEARTYAGLVNMRDQHGTAMDMAQLIRDTKIPPSGMEALGISMNEAKTSDAAGLSQLSDFLWKQVRTKNMPESWGVVLGREMPDDTAGQNEVYKEVAGKKLTAEQLTDTIRLQRSAERAPGQESLWGKDFFKASTLPQQVKILGEVRDTLDDTAKGMARAVKGKGMLETAGETKIDAPEMQKRALEARQLNNMMPKFVYQGSSETNNVLKQLAYDLAEKPNEKNSIYERARATLPVAVRTDAARAGIEIGQEPVEPETAQGGLFGGGGTPSDVAKSYGWQLATNREGADIYDHGSHGGRLKVFPDGSWEHGIRSGKGATSLGAELKNSGDIRTGTGDSTLSGGIVPLQAAEKAQSLARAVSTKLGASRPVTWLKQVFAPETMGPFAERATAIQEEQAAELRARVGSARVALEPFRKYMEGVEPSQRWNIYSQLEQGNYDVLPKEIRPAIEAARGGLDKSWAEISKLKNGEVGYIENYLPHLYTDDPEKVQGVFKELQQATGKKLQGEKGFVKQRYYSLMSDAIAKGLTPRFDNPADMILAGQQNQWRYVTGQRIFSGLKEAGLTRFLREGEQMPRGYAPIDDRIAQVRQFAPEYKGYISRGTYVAPEQAARIINNYTGPGLKGGLFRSVSAMGNALRVELSTFHMLLESNSVADIEAGGAMAEGFGKLAHGDFVGGAKALARVPKTWLTPVEGYKAWKLGRADQAAAHAGLFDDPAVRDEITAGGSFDFGDSVMTQALSEAFGDKLGIVGRGAKNLLGLTMRKVVTPMKLGALRMTYSRMLDEAVERNGGEELTYVQRRGLLQQARKHIDNVMGQIARDNLHTTNTLKDQMGMIIAYPGWNIGTVRLFGGLGRGFQEIATGQSLDTQARLALQYAAGKVLRVGVTGIIANKLITGEWPKTIYDMYTNPTGQKDSKGNWIRMEAPEYMLRDLLSVMGRKKKEDPNDIMGWPKAIEGSVASKLNWPLQAGYEIAKNADYFGRPIYFPHADALPTQAFRILKHIANTGGVPFSLKNIEEQRQQAGGTVGAAGTAKEIASSVMGFTPAPRTLRQTPMQNYVDQLEDQQIRTQPQSPQALQRQQAMGDLRRQMRQARTGDTKQMPDMKAALAKGLTPQDISKEWEQSKLSPLESALHRVPYIEVAKAYNIAKDHDDKGDMKVALKVLGQRWGNLKPEERAQAAPMLRDILTPKKKEEREAAGAV